MTTPFKIGDKVTLRVPVRLPSRMVWLEELGPVESLGREIVPGLQLWIELVGVERATVSDTDGTRFEVDLSNLVAW